MREQLSQFEIDSIRIRLGIKEEVMLTRDEVTIVLSELEENREHKRWANHA